MPYNPFRNSILKPATKSWADVEGDILTVKIPYALLKHNKEYNFKFSYFADDGFFFEEPGTITNSDLEDLCEACLFKMLSSAQQCVATARQRMKLRGLIVGIITCAPAC